MIEGGRDLWISSSPILLLKAGSLLQVLLGHVQLDAEHLLGWRLHNLTEQHVPTLTVKIVMFKWNFLCFNLCLLPFATLLGTTKKNLASLLPPHAPGISTHL